MSWARLDDDLLDSPQIVSVEALAELFYFRARIYVEKHRSRGFVPNGAVRSLTRGLDAYRLHPSGRAVQPLDLVGQLVKVDLLTRDEGGIQVVGWERWTRPERDREELRAAGRRGGKRSVEVRRDKYGTAQPVEANPEASGFGLLRSSRDGTGRDGTYTRKTRGEI